MVVKFADTQKEKEQKKVQQLQTNLWSLSGINPNAAVMATGNPQYLAVNTMIVLVMNVIHLRLNLFECNY